MDFEHKSPGFTAPGTEPPASLKSEGFQPGYKPPAAYFNWFWTSASACIEELQNTLRSLKAGDIEAAEASLNNVTSDIFRDKAIEAGVGGTPVVAAESTDGVAYTATVQGVKELYNGFTVTIIPNMTSTARATTLNVNGWGAIDVRQPLSFNTAAMTLPKMDTFLSEGRPVTVQYDAEYVAGGMWKTVDKQKTSAQDLYGTVPVEGGGTGATDGRTALKNLGIEIQRGVRDNVNTSGVQVTFEEEFSGIPTVIATGGSAALAMTVADWEMLQTTPVTARVVRPVAVSNIQKNWTHRSGSNLLLEIYRITAWAAGSR